MNSEKIFLGKLERVQSVTESLDQRTKPVTKKEGQRHIFHYFSVFGVEFMEQ